jgi:hypothetical protein
VSMYFLGEGGGSVPTRPDRRWYCCKTVLPTLCRTFRPLRKKIQFPSKFHLLKEFGLMRRKSIFLKFYPYSALFVQNRLKFGRSTFYSALFDLRGRKIGHLAKLLL